LFIQLQVYSSDAKPSNLWRKGSCLFVCHIEISQTMVSLAILLGPLRSTWCVGVNQVGFIMFQLMVEKLMNTEIFFHSKFI
jgi:hypothetical protein